MKTNTRRRAPKARKKLGFLGIIGLILVALGLMFRIGSANAVDPAPLNPDDWNLELAFFDSTVDDGRTPLTNEQWLLPTSYAPSDYERIVTLQITYRNEHVSRDYAPGELQIKLSNIFTTDATTAAQLKVAMAVGANKSTQHSYDWDYNDATINTQGFIFTNANAIEQDANFEGTIQVVFGLTSQKEEFENWEKYEDHCTHSLEQTGIKAVMNNAVNSNEVEFHFSRTYDHVWTHVTYNLAKTASKIKSYDNMGEGVDQYTWVRYRFGGKAIETEYMSFDTEDYQSYVGLSDYQIMDQFPSDVKLLTMNGATITPDANGYVDIKQVGARNTTDGQCANEYYTCLEILAGYPKSIYNENAGNMEITNSATMTGTYLDGTTMSVPAASELQLNLADFSFEPDEGEGPGISKAFVENINAGENASKKYYYQEIINDGSTGHWNNYATSKFNGTAYDVQIGDDLVYYEPSNGLIKRLTDNQYYFTKVEIPVFANSNEAPVVATKYQPKLYVRYRGSNEYVLHSQYEALGQEVVFEGDQKVVGWYVEISGLTEGMEAGNFAADLTIQSDEFAENGKIYNFNYLKVLQNGELQNPFEWDDYGNQFTRDTLGNYDVEHYGAYLQRSYAEAEWEYHELGTMTRYLQPAKSVDKLPPDFDPETETFSGKYYMYASVQEHSAEVFSDNVLNAQAIPEENWITEMSYYDLLPMGMDIMSTEEEIEATAGNTYCTMHSELVYGKDGKPLFDDWSTCRAYVKSHVDVKVEKNWHETGRDYIRVTFDYSEAPFSTLNNKDVGPRLASVEFKYSISYDAYMEYGRRYVNNVYADAVGLKTTRSQWSSYVAVDNGERDAAAVDINENGNTTEWLDMQGFAMNLLVATSTKQDLKKTVKTEHSGRYDTEAFGEYGEDYSYRVRTMTGLNRTTNVVLYDALETAYGNNEHWQGAFNGVDTSYAETQLDAAGNAIKVKTYYSQNASAGSLNSDNSWQEYIEGTTDKTKVKALAFKLVDQNGNAATLPASSYVYVTILMKAPANKALNSAAYNTARSEWNAIDNASGQPVTTITGINSNTTTVDLRAKYDLTVKKVWDDYNDYYELRPDEVSFELYKGDELVETKTMSSGETQVVFEDLTLDDKAQYRVEEVALEHYTATSQLSGDTYTFTNKVDQSAPEPFSITVNKVWSDYNNYYKVRPEKVTFKLYQGDNVIATRDLTVSSGSQVVFDGLYARDRSVFRVEEEAIDGYTTTMEFDSENLIYTFTNTINREEPGPLSLTVKKVWDDYDDYYGLRPQKATFKLYKGDELIETKELDAALGEGEIVFDGLRALEIEQYRVEEEAIDEYTTSFVFDEENMTYIFTNKVNREAPVPEETPNTYDGLTRVVGLVVTALTGTAVVAFGLMRRRA